MTIVVLWSVSLESLADGFRGAIKLPGFVRFVS